MRPKPYSTMSWGFSSGGTCRPITSAHSRLTNSIGVMLLPLSDSSMNRVASFPTSMCDGPRSSCESASQMG